MTPPGSSSSPRAAATPAVAAANPLPAGPDRVPAREKFSLGLGQAAAMGTHNALTTLANPIYNVLMGMNPAHLSVLTFVQRLWDAFLDPFVGQLSDNTRSRWGRRRPFLLAASVPLGLGFAALWLFPASLSPNALVAYVLVASLVFYLFHSFYFVPLTAMQVEATTDYHERTRVASVVGICTWVFSITNQWLYTIVQSKTFSTPLVGLRCVAIVAGCVYIGLALAPAFFVRERGLAAPVRGQPKPPFFGSLREATRNRDFVLLLGARGVSQFGYAVVAILGFYLNCYLVHGGDIRAASAVQGWLGTAYVAGSVTAFWLFREFALRFGKQRTLQVSAGLLIIGAVAKVIVYQPGWRWAQLVVPATNGLALAGIQLMTTAMVADIVSADELATGQRREGLYCSVLSWFDKMGGSMGGLIAGFLLVWLGFDVKLGGQQSTFTLQAMKGLYAALPCLGALATVMFAHFYRLDEAKAYEIKRALEARAAATAS